MTRVSREVIRNQVWLTFLLLLTSTGFLGKIFPNYPVGVLVDVAGLFLLFEFLGLITIKNLKLVDTPISGLLLLFLAFGVFQIFNPFLLNPIIGFQGFRALFAPMSLFFVGANLVTTRKQVHTILMYLLYLGSFASILGIIQAISVYVGMATIVPIGDNYGYYYLGSFLKEKVVLAYGGPLFRITSTFDTFSSFAFFLGMFILTGFGFYYSTRKKWFLLLSIVGMIAMLLTFVRIGYVSLLCGSLFLAYLRSKRKRFRNVLKVLIVASLVVFVFAILPNHAISERVLSFFSGQSSGSAASAFMVRISMYRMYIEKFGSRLLIGNGLGTTAGISAKYAGGLTFGVVTADNDAINILYQTGVFGLFLFIVIVGRILYYGYRIVEREEPSLLVGSPATIYGILVFVIVSGLAYNPLVERPSSYLFWFFAGILLSYRHKKGEPG